MSFSGGKDSTVLLDLVRQIYPEVPAVFVDTGLEYPEIRDFVKNTDNVIWLKPEKNFKQVIQEYGYPVVSKEVSKCIYYYRKNPSGWAKERFDDDSEHSKKYGRRFSNSKWIFLRDSDIPVSNYCCDIMKKSPVKKFERLTGRKPIIGTMAEESMQRVTAWLKNSCNAFESKRPISQPLSFWSKQDILLYLKQFNVKYASVYGDIVEDKHNNLVTTGCDRTGCVFCMFGCHLEKEPNRFQKLKQTHPKLYEYCLRDWSKGGLGMKQVLDFIGVKYD